MNCGSWYLFVVFVDVCVSHLSVLRKRTRELVLIVN